MSLDVQVGGDLKHFADFPQSAAEISYAKIKAMVIKTRNQVVSSHYRNGNGFFKNWVLPKLTRRPLDDVQNKLVKDYCQNS